jgi:cytochrome c5
MRRKLPGAGGISPTRVILYCIVAMLSGPVSGPAQVKGDAEAGRLKAYHCLGCHGIPGYITVYPAYHVPKLGGQNAQYIVSALQAYKAGQRDHETMHAQAQTLSKKDMADVAAYFSSIGGPVPGGKQMTKASADGGQQAAKTQADAGKKTAAKLAATTASTPEGESTYQIMCATCHDSGALGAPKITDKAAWQARIAMGKQALYSSAISGVGAMPPKGGHPQLSEEKVKAAVDHIIATVTGNGAQGQQQPVEAKKGQ